MKATAPTLLVVLLYCACAYGLSIPAHVSSAQAPLTQRLYANNFGAQLESLIQFNTRAGGLLKAEKLSDYTLECM